MERQAVGLLEHGLRDMYDAELRFVDALGTMVENANDESLADGFRRHQKVTREHVRRIERAFDEIGISPGREDCAGARGLIQEYQRFVKDRGRDGELVDTFAAGAGLKLEHYEIAAYRALIDLAEFCDFGPAASLLKQNLAEEEQAAVEMQTAATKLGAKLAGASVPALAGRALGGVVDQAREGATLAADGAKVVGERAVGRARTAIRKAERRGRKVTAKRRASVGSRSSASGRKARPARSVKSTGAGARARRTAGTTRSRAGRTRTRSTGPGPSRARRSTTRSRSSAAARRAKPAKRAASPRRTGASRPQTRRRTGARKTTGRRRTSR